MNNDMFSSLSRMLEEYSRLVKPITEQINIQDRWQAIASPILRVAELNKEILSGASKVDVQLAEKISMLVHPFQSLLDDMKATQCMMGLENFAKLVKPQIYITGITDTLTNSISAPWKTDLSTLSNMELTVLPQYDTNYGRLCKLEKNIAGLPSVTSQFNQMNSISAQIASLSQIDLTESWKQAIIPPETIRELNLFALKQYGKIEKSTDEKEIIWRFGLIDSASKYVDRQALWGTELATASKEDVPKTITSIPNFSELPKLLASAKRDERNVEHKFEESLFTCIPEKGKMIVKKAQLINEYCKLRSKNTIFPQRNLLDWAIVLSGPFCREPEKLNEVIRILQAMFVSEKVINLIGNQNCFDELVLCESDTTKSAVSKKQDRLYDMFMKVEDKLIAYFEECPNSSIDEDTVTTDIFRALLNVQKNKIYYGKNENVINDGIRDALDMKYTLRDQTRQGESESGKEAGEVDLALYDNGMPFAIIEGLKLCYVDKTVFGKHINKALTKYDPTGCPLVCILVYATVGAFDEFWEALSLYFRNYSFPYEVSKDFYEIATNFTQSRHGKIILQRNGKKVNLHLYAIAMK